MLSSSTSILASVNKGINVIEASAGTGKTFHLSFLFIRLYLQHKISLEKLCAITFTNLAIAELRQRIKTLFKEVREELYQQQSNLTNQHSSTLAPIIKEWLEDNFNKSDYPQIIKDCHFALLHLHRSKITTIHSFFQELLKRYYFYADLNSQFDIIAENAQWKELTAMWAKEFWLKQTKDRQTREYPIFTHFFSTPEKLLLNVPTDSTGRAIAMLDSSPDWVLFLETISTKGKGSKVYKQCERISKHYFKNQFLDFIHKKTDTLVQNGQFSYNLILEKALMVSKNKQFCANVRQDIQAILIDEFQDTDYIQWNVIKNIFLSNKTKNENNIVCLIGDPKQSIYRFRSADIDCYFEAIQLAQDKTNLSLNWRSDKKLLDVLNTIYQSNSLSPTPFEHQDLHYTVVSPPEQKGEKSSLSLVRENEETKEMLEEAGVILRAPHSLERRNKEHSEQQMNQWLLQDCLQLCALIQQKKAYIQHKNNSKQLLQYADILILCRTNDHILKISQLLQQYGIPLSREVRIHIWQSKAAQRIIALLQLLNARPPTANLTKIEIRSLSILLGFEGNEHDQQLVENVMKTFHQWQVVFDSQGPLALWQKILVNQCYGHFHISHSHLPNYLEEMTQLFEKIQVWWKEGLRGIDSWLKQIQINIHLNENHISQDKAIRLMTVHRAKGLEAPIVICPDLWYGGVNKTDPFSDYLSYSSEKQHYCLTEEANLNAKKIEAHRLLYVALTRARSKLILYWMPYQHRGKVNSIESLLFIPSNSEAIDEKSNLERLNNIQNLTLLQGEEKLLSTIKITYQKEKTVFNAEPNPIKNSDILTPPKPNSGLWSFTRLYRSNVQHNHTHEEYEKDKEVELSWQVQDDKTIQQENSANNAKQMLNAARLGTLVHKLIETILVNNTITTENLSQNIEQESRALLRNLALPQEQQEKVQKLIVSLSKATLKCSLSIADTQTFYPLYSSCWQKFCEIRFDLNVDYWKLDKVNKICQKYPHLPLSALNPMTIENTLFYGFIDLVLMPTKTNNDSTIWIVDFKTNFLGEQAQDYSYANMHQAMLESYYGWQAIFYALAIYRWSKTMQTNTSSPINIQIAYLFSRGLALNKASSTVDDVEKPLGKYILELSAEMLAELSEILS